MMAICANCGQEICGKIVEYHGRPYHYVERACLVYALERADKAEAEAAALRAKLDTEWDANEQREIALSVLWKYAERLEDNLDLTSEEREELRKSAGIVAWSKGG
jgi:hypothetical protein